MLCLGDVLTKTLPYDVFHDVLEKPKHRASMFYKKAKHRTNNASNGVNRPPLLAVSLYYLMTTQI